MHKRRTVAWLVAVAVGLTLIPAAGAMAQDVGAASETRAEKRKERRQNARITRVVRQVATINTNVATLTTAVNGAGELIVGLTTKTDGIDTRLKTIEAAAPQIISGLAQLKTGLEQAGAGLNSLKTLATSTEYGIGQLIVLTPSPAPQAGSFVVTPDIPDAVQQAQTTQQFVAQHTGNLAVAYGVRSAESDGTGASLPAAHCKVTVTNEGGTTQTTAANPGLGGLPFQPVDTKSKQTSTDPANAGFPFGLKTSGDDADVTTTFVSTVGVTAGDTYTVGLSCVDTSPSADDPSA